MNGYLKIEVILRLLSMQREITVKGSTANYHRDHRIIVITIEAEGRASFR